MIAIDDVALQITASVKDKTAPQELQFGRAIIRLDVRRERGEVKHKRFFGRIEDGPEVDLDGFVYSAAAFVAGAHLGATA
jgi:hypothetical protein